MQNTQSICRLLQDKSMLEAEAQGYACFGGSCTEARTEYSLVQSKNLVHLINVKTSLPLVETIASKIHVFSCMVCWKCKCNLNKEMGCCCRQQFEFLITSCLFRKEVILYIKCWSNEGGQRSCLCTTQTCHALCVLSRCAQRGTTRKSAFIYIYE